MTTKKSPLRPSPSPSAVDMLLTSVAIRVQLSQTDYNKAVQHYQAINNWIERDESSLKDVVTLFYPQGSMAIGATIASKLTTDEFDIDIVAQLNLPDKVSPQEVLDQLYEAIRGETGSQYYEMAKRRTRCVTIDYSDDMHIDVTPALRIYDTPERQSWIFHHQQETPHEQGSRLIANPYGFAAWFKTNTPRDDDFASFFEMCAKEHEQLVLATADSDPVPSQEPSFRKSKAVIVLQLLKRWRNVQYDKRSERRPPSIMMTKLVADAANHTNSLSEELLLQAKSMLSFFRQSHNQNQRVRIINPVCAEDVLTDRWPESLRDQGLFIDDLQVLVDKVEQLVKGCDLEVMQDIMAYLFGEAPAKDAIRAFNKQIGKQIDRGGSQYDPQKRGLVIPASAGITGQSTIPTRRHRFYGTERRKR